jgi:glycosyltransferase involved in cell wall biosynthesis
MSQVQILLSTYNGERYLEPQLRSLFEQDHPELKVLARDDGSTDRSWDILQSHTRQGWLTAVRGENWGVVRSYFWLLSHADPGAEYVAFADQDDVWLADKVSRALRRLRPLAPDRPAMYCSRLAVVDDNLIPIGRSPLPRRGPSFENALVQNIATGCTVVLNRPARDLLLRELPRNVPMHDWWAYLVVSAFGEVLYDPEPRILYRQHAGNVVGAARNPIGRLATKAVRFARRGFALLSGPQAREFRRIYGAQLDSGRRAKLDRFLDARYSWGQRLRFALGDDIVYQSGLDNAIFKGLYVLNRA